MLVGVLGVAAGVAGCGESVSTSSYTGQSLLVAKRVSAFQKDVTDVEQSKICIDDLSVPLKDSIAASESVTGTHSADTQHAKAHGHLAKEPTERPSAMPNATPAGETFSKAPAKATKICEASIKEQLKNVESLTLNISSIEVHGDQATAKVLSTWSGKEKYATIRLAKENGTWLIAGL